MIFRHLSLLIIAVLLSKQAQACPLVDQFIDFNCDQRLRISVVGDSIVAGVGGQPGGYVSILRRRVRAGRIHQMGRPGITTQRLLAEVKQTIAGRGNRVDRNSLLNADYIFIDVGRNDYWNREPAGITIRNIIRIKRYLEKQVARRKGSAPFIVVSTMLPTNRFFQRPFIDELNERLLRRKVALVHFHKIKSNLLSDDGLHPTQRGYRAMGKIMNRYVRQDLQAAASTLRPDADNDGVYDLFETIRFGTDPQKYDTDGDGWSDGEELFIYHTDPLDPESHPEL